MRLRVIGTNSTTSAVNIFSHDQLTGSSRTRQVNDGNLYVALKTQTLLQNTSRTRQLKDGDLYMALRLELCFKIPHVRSTTSEVKGKIYCPCHTTQAQQVR